MRGVLSVSLSFAVGMLAALAGAVGCGVPEPSPEPEVAARSASFISAPPSWSCQRDVGAASVLRPGDRYYAGSLHPQSWQLRPGDFPGGRVAVGDPAGFWDHHEAAVSRWSWMPGVETPYGGRRIYTGRDLPLFSPHDYQSPIEASVGALESGPVRVDSCGNLAVDLGVGSLVSGDTRVGRFGVGSRESFPFYAISRPQIDCMAEAPEAFPDCYARHLEVFDAARGRVGNVGEMWLGQSPARGRVLGAPAFVSTPGADPRFEGTTRSRAVVHLGDPDCSIEGGRLEFDVVGRGTYVLAERDPGGWLKSTHPEAIHYGALGETGEQLYVLTRIVLPPPASYQAVFTYDEERTRLRSFADNRGRSVTYSYDDLGRLIEYADQDGRGHQYAYATVNGKSFLTEMTLRDVDPGSGAPFSAATYRIVWSGGRIRAVVDQSGTGVEVTAYADLQADGFTPISPPMVAGLRGPTTYDGEPVEHSFSYSHSWLGTRAIGHATSLDPAAADWTVFGFNTVTHQPAGGPGEMLALDEAGEVTYARQGSVAWSRFSVEGAGSCRIPLSSTSVWGAGGGVFSTASWDVENPYRYTVQSSGSLQTRVQLDPIDPRRPLWSEELRFDGSLAERSVYSYGGGPLPQRVDSTVYAGDVPVSSRSTSYSWDERGQPTEVVTTHPTGRVERSTFGWDAAGNLVSQSGGFGSATRTIQRGVVVSGTLAPLGGRAVTESLQFTAGLLSRVNHADGSSSQFGWDGNRRLTTVSHGGLSATLSYVPGTTLWQPTGTRTPAFARNYQHGAGAYRPAAESSFAGVPGDECTAPASRCWPTGDGSVAQDCAPVRDPATGLSVFRWRDVQECGRVCDGVEEWCGECRLTQVSLRYLQDAEGEPARVNVAGCVSYQRIETDFCPWRCTLPLLPVTTVKVPTTEDRSADGMIVQSCNPSDTWYPWDMCCAPAGAMPVGCSCGVITGCQPWENSSNCPEDCGWEMPMPPPGAPPPVVPPTDGGPTDGGPTDGGPTDGGPTDGGPTDGGPTDGGPTDGGPIDGGYY